MTAQEQAVLLKMLDEIEDLRAHQVVTTVALSALHELSTTNLPKLKETALEKNVESYAALRQTIAEL
jgi:hypothetical protein